MLRNWLILASNTSQARQIKECSSYKAVESLKEARVSLLSGEYTGVIVLSILETDTTGFPGFIASLKNHPELSKVQVVLLDNLDSLFVTREHVGLQFFTLEQISKLIDLDLGSENILDQELGAGLDLSTIEVTEDMSANINNVDYLKHVCAKAIANMILEKEIAGEKNKAVEIFLKRVRQGVANIR